MTRVVRLAAVTSSAALVGGTAAARVVHDESLVTTVLSGQLSSSQIRQRVFTIEVGRPAPFADDGYIGRFNGLLSLTLRRGSVGSQFIEAPSF
jgi:hypothetical protein